MIFRRETIIMRINGPAKLNLLQQINFLINPLEVLDSWFERYGDIFKVGAKNFPTAVYISNPKHIQEIFSANPEIFESGKGNGVMKPLVGEQSLLLQDGIKHSRQRRWLTPPFHGQRMQIYGQLMHDITKEVINQCKLNQPFSVRSFTQEISLKVILHTIFGLYEGERSQLLKQLLSHHLDSIGSPISSSLLLFRSLQKDLGAWSPWGRFLHRRQQIDQIIFNEIQQRRFSQDTFRTDILTLLMAVRDESGQPMTDVELKDELLTLLIAGHEAVASALAWMFYWIDNLTEVRNKLTEEINNLGEQLELDKIINLPYLNAFCQETLRIYPVAMFTFSRILRIPTTLMGYSFDAGTYIIPCIYLTHQREDIYPKPKQFKPERFLERQFSSYEYLPFGGGNRRCIGSAFALFEIKIVLATVLSSLQFTIVNRHSIHPERRGINLAPSKNMQMLVTKICTNCIKDKK